jgi:ribonuclease HI
MAIWNKIGVSSHQFFSSNSIQAWLKEGVNSSQSILFLSGLWWIWRHRNLMCLGNETLSINRLCSNIFSLVEAIKSAFFNTATTPSPDRFICWNNNDIQCTILNVDGSCNGDPIRSGFGGILRHHSGNYISAFSGFINHSQDILFAEFTAHYQGVILVINMNYEEVACYSDSLQTVNLINEGSNHFHVYAVLIQNIKDLIAPRNFTLHHSLREGNQCADFFAKLGASNDAELTIHSNPPEGVLPLPQLDELGTPFLRRQLPFFLFAFLFCMFLFLLAL